MKKKLSHLPFRLLLCGAAERESLPRVLEVGIFPQPTSPLPSASFLRPCRPQLSLFPPGESLACCPCQPQCSCDFRLLEFSGHVFDVPLDRAECTTGKKPIFPGSGVGAILKFGEGRPWKAQSPLVGRAVIELLPTPPPPQIHWPWLLERRFWEHWTAVWSWGSADSLVS